MRKAAINKSVRQAQLEFQVLSAKSAIAPVSDAVGRFLALVLPEKEVMRLKLGLQEALENGFEHGNLAISSAEKAAAIAADTFEQLIRERSRIALAKGKTIVVSIEFSAIKCKLTVQDAGKGFDWKALSSATHSEANLESCHGRGLRIIYNTFDSVTYNKRGNQVTLVKKFNSAV